MVSLNLPQYRGDVKRALLVRKNELDQEWDPFVASWLAYAFAHERGAQPLLLQDVFQRLDSWVQEESAWEYKRNIGPLLFFIWLRKQLQLSISESYVENAVKMLQELSVGQDDRFSPFRFPEQVFLMALGASALENSKVRETLIGDISSHVKGSVARQMLFNAALRELGEKFDLPLLKPVDITDTLVILWWSERYGERVDKGQYWAQFESIADTILFNKAEEFDTRRILSEWELVLLYEALMQQTSRPDPKMLFDFYPLHPSIRKIAEEDFKNGSYFSAVFEACKVFFDFLRKCSGDINITEVQAVKRILGDPNAKDENLKPLITLNPLESTSPDYRSQQNEQRGYGHLGIGVFMAFRHPKGHEPKDKEWVKIGPYEALDQLVVISLVMKRIEEAAGSNP